MEYSAALRKEYPPPGEDCADGRQDASFVLRRPRDGAALLGRATRAALIPGMRAPSAETKGRMDGLPRHPPFLLSLFPVFRTGLCLRPSEHRTLCLPQNEHRALGRRLRELVRAL